MLKSLPSASRLDALFRPKTVALVGVSDRLKSYGHTLDRISRNAGFSGQIFGVNPRLAGRDTATFASLEELPTPVDHVVISVANDRVEQAVEDALSAGAAALTVFAQCPEKHARERISDAVKGADAILCGPNSMGLHDFHSGLRLSPFDVPLDRKPGGVGLISQSGSVLGALINNGRRVQFSQAISTGSETVTTAADYLAWMLEQPETRCVGMFIESVRDPECFMNAMELAAERGIPVVINKVGRSELGAQLAMSHTGAIVGNDDVFRATVSRFGGHLVASIDQMAALLAVFSQGRKSMATGLASIHDSGGERELIADLAEVEGVEFANLSAQTTLRIQTVLEDGIHAQNPLDAWGTGSGAEQTFEQATVAMLEDPNVGLGFYVLNWRDKYDLHEMHERALKAAFSKTSKPLLAVSNFALSRSDDMADRLGDFGIPVIGGLQNAVLAAKAFLNKTLIAPRNLNINESKQADKYRSAFRGKDWISEADGYAALAAYGICVPQHSVAKNRDDAIQFAEHLKQSVACKTAMPGVYHKTDVGGIVLNLGNAAEVGAAYDELSAGLGPNVLVVEMLPHGSEWSLGAVIDPDFGPFVRIAPGGTLVELLPESALLMAPFTRAEAKAAILSLRASKLLQGYRGAPVQNLSALADAAAALSRLAWDLRDCLSEIEINPIIVSEKAATAADAVIHITKNHQGGEQHEVLQIR